MTDHFDDHSNDPAPPPRRAPRRRLGVSVRCVHCGCDLIGRAFDDDCPDCHAPVADSARDPSADPNASRPAGPLHCIECGYDLEGLPADSRCPECATAIERSRSGALLANAGDAYLKTLRTGARLIVGALLASVILTLATLGAGIAFGLLGALTAPGPGGPALGAAGALITINIVAAIGGVAIAIASFAGWWLLTQPDPAFSGRDKGQTARRLVRIAVGVRAVVTVAQLPVTLLSTGTIGAPTASPIFLLSILAGLAAAGAWILQFFASMRYIQWLARRIPDQRMHKTAGQYMWVLPLVYILGLACLGLGPLVAFILYLILLEQLRRRITAVIRMREARA